MRDRDWRAALGMNHAPADAATREQQRLIRYLFIESAHFRFGSIFSQSKFQPELLGSVTQSYWFRPTWNGMPLSLAKGIGVLTEPDTPTLPLLMPLVLPKD
jgi:hypothetical protein